MFNYREGFNRIDDQLPDRFYEDAYTVGVEKGAIVDRDEFKSVMDTYYKEREWDPETTMPKESKLKSLGLEFTING